MQIRQHLVPSRHQKTYGGVNGRTWITVHETANPAKGATANAHARLQAGGNSRNASWHYQVDSTEVVQSYPDTAQCFHSGGGRDNGNLNSIAIEICVNDGKPHPQAVANAQALVRHLMGLYNIPVERVVQHNYWSGKNCPTNLRKSGWAAFLAGLNQKEEEDDMPTLAEIQKAVWVDRTVYRGGERISAIQELADAKTLALENRAQIAALAKAQGLDPTVLANAVKDAFKSLEVKVVVD